VDRVRPHPPELRHTQALVVSLWRHAARPAAVLASGRGCGCRRECRHDAAEFNGLVQALDRLSGRIRAVAKIDAVLAG